jgi:predicted O-methyltransferase YrrM
MNEDIPNWFDYPDLYKQLAEQIPEGATFVEVGAWIGHSVSYFASEVKKLGKKVRIVAIDTFKGSATEDLQKNIAEQAGGSFRNLFDATLAQAGVLQMVDVIEGDSVSAAKEFEDASVWGVFIDADHTTEGVLRDIAAWKPKVIKGGALAGHDIDSDAVRSAVEQSHDEYVVSGRCWICI